MCCNELNDKGVPRIHMENAQRERESKVKTIKMCYTVKSMAMHCIELSAWLLGKYNY